MSQDRDEHTTTETPQTDTSNNCKLATEPRVRLARVARHFINWSASTDQEWPRDTLYLRRHWKMATSLFILGVAILIFGLISDITTGISFFAKWPQPGPDLIHATTWLGFVCLFVVAGVAPLTYVIPKSGVVLTITRFEFVTLVALPFIGFWQTLTSALLAATILGVLYRPRTLGRSTRTSVHWMGWLGANTLVTSVVFVLLLPVIGGWAFVAAGAASAAEEMIDRRVSRWAVGKTSVSWACFAPLPMKIIGGLFAWAIYSSTNSMVVAAVAALAVLVLVRLLLAGLAYGIWVLWQTHALKTIAKEIEVSTSLLRDLDGMPANDAIERLLSKARVLLPPFALSELWIHINDRGDGRPGTWAWALNDCINSSKLITERHQADPTASAAQAFHEAERANPVIDRGSLMVPIGDAAQPLGHILMIRQPNSFKLSFSAWITARTLGQAIVTLLRIAQQRNTAIPVDSLIHEETGVLNVNAWHQVADLTVRRSVASGETSAVLICQAPIPNDVIAAIHALAIPGRTVDADAIKREMGHQVLHTMRKVLASQSSLSSRLTVGYDTHNHQAVAVLGGYTNEMLPLLTAAFAEATMEAPLVNLGIQGRMKISAKLRWAIAPASLHLNSAATLVTYASNELAMQDSTIDNYPAVTTAFSQTPLRDLQAVLAQHQAGNSTPITLDYSTVRETKNSELRALHATLRTPEGSGHEHMWEVAGANVATLLSLWDAYLKLATSDAKMWMHGAAISKAALILDVPVPLLSQAAHPEAWRLLREAVQLEGLSPSKVHLSIDKIEDFSAQQGNAFLREATGFGFSLITQNGRGLSSCPSGLRQHISGTIVGNQIWTEYQSGRSGALILMDDLRAAAGKHNQFETIVESPPLTSQRDRDQAQHAGVTAIAAAPAPLLDALGIPSQPFVHA